MNLPRRREFLGCVVVGDPSIGQGEVGEEVMRADDAANRQVGDRRVHVRDEMQAAGPDPRSLDDDVGEIDGDELGDLRMAVDARNDLQVDLSAEGL